MDSSRRDFLKSALCCLPLPAFVRASSLWLPPERPPVYRPTRWVAEIVEIYDQGMMPFDFQLLNEAIALAPTRTLLDVDEELPRCLFKKPGRYVRTRQAEWDGPIVHFGQNRAVPERTLFCPTGLGSTRWLAGPGDEIRHYPENGARCYDIQIGTVQVDFQADLEPPATTPLPPL